MKTVFKEGMEVYDQLNFPNKKGVIVEISNDENDPYPVEVSFENEAGRKYYTPEGRFNKKHIPTLSTKPYEIELKGFEQKASAPTYEEAVKWIENNKRYNPAYVEIDEKEKVFLSKTYFYAFEALRKLIVLRDYYNEGWQPDWNDNATKYSIEVEVGEIVGRNHHCNARIMSFKTNDVRNKFLEEQKELLEIAKPLL